VKGTMRRSVYEAFDLRITENDDNALGSIRGVA